MAKVSSMHYNDISHCQKSSEDSIRFLRTNLNVLSNQIPKEETSKFLAFIRHYTQNPPLVVALHLLLKFEFLNQASRIALEEGLYSALDQFVQ